MHQRFLLFIIPLLLCGCVSSRSQQDIGQIEQATYNAAASLPPSPQTAAIEANAVTVSQIVGAPITTVSSTAAAVTGTTP
jgi:hypothetical protein